VPGRATTAGGRHESIRTDVSELWIEDLQSTGARRADAERRLYALLLKAADFEVRRRAPAAGITDIEDLVTQSADDALVAILRKLHTYRGESRFTTWAYKFALYEAAAKTRRRAWRDRELPLEAEFPGRGLQEDVETAELLRLVARGIERRLTPHQREVMIALAINGVPIDVLAERLQTTRGALYKTLHDARRALRAYLADHDRTAVL
jgi:RNA polymerase sigma-70 factor (ECF subfamily)